GRHMSGTLTYDVSRCRHGVVRLDRLTPYVYNLRRKQFPEGPPTWPRQQCNDNRAQPVPAVRPCRQSSATATVLLTFSNSGKSTSRHPGTMKYWYASAPPPPIRVIGTS